MYLSAQRSCAAGTLAISGCQDILKKLCDVQHGRLPIHLAALKGHCDVIALLVEHGSPLYFRDYDGTAPLHNAVKYGHVKAAELLIACGASAIAPLQV